MEGKEEQNLLEYMDLLITDRENKPDSPQIHSKTTTSSTTREEMNDKEVKDTELKEIDDF